MSPRIRIIPNVVAVLLALLLAGGAAHAVILSANGLPPATTVAGPYLQGDTQLTVPVTWQVNAPLGPQRVNLLPPFTGGPNARFFDPSNTIRSAGGRFVLDTGSVQTLLEVDLALEQMVVGPVTTFSETLTVPAFVFEEARRRGAQRVLFVRQFEDELVFTEVGGGQAVIRQPPTRRSAAVAFYLSPSVGGELAVFRVQLRFDEGETLKFANTGEDVRVWADVFYRGTGRLEGVWEVADPGSTSGAPIYRPLERVVRLLGAGQRLSLRGPVLPTRTAGLHEVRFRFTGATDPAFADPIIRYQVMADAPGIAPDDPRPIVITAPGRTVDLSPETTFAWGGVSGSAAYQLEVFELASALAAEEGVARRFDERTERYQDITLGGEPTAFEGSSQQAEDRNPPAGQRVTGVMLPPESVQTSLDALTREHLVPGEQYLWRVIAFGPDGRRLGESELRSLRVPILPAASPAP